MNKVNKIIVPIIVLMAACQTVSADAQLPRLVVLVTVDGLRADLVEEVEPHMSEEGWRRLKQSARLYPRVDSPLLEADEPTSVAIVHTGTTPVHNGIVARQPWLRKGEDRYQAASVFEDVKYAGLATSSRMSAEALQAPTIGDLIKSATAGRGRVYSIAPHAEEAIIGGGRSADGVYWIDSYSGRWCSSTYYPEKLPWYMDRLNKQEEGLAIRLSRGMSAKPLFASDGARRYGTHLLYPYDSSEAVGETFTKSTASIERLKHSGYANDEVVRAAKALVGGAGLGADAATDLLALHMTVATPDQPEGDRSVQMIDAYYRMDRALADLWKTIADSGVSMDQVVVAVVGTGQATQPRGIGMRDLAFNIDECRALLNMYLTAKTSLRGLISDMTGRGEVLLNRPLIEADGRYTVDGVQDLIAGFLPEVSGVAYAIASHQLTEQSLLQHDNRWWQTALNRSKVNDRADVYYGLRPGWHSSDQQRGTDHHMGSAVETVALIYVPGQKSQQIYEPLDLRYFARELCRVLRIRPPTSR